jgi:hypothetical protein
MKALLEDSRSNMKQELAAIQEESERVLHAVAARAQHALEDKLALQNQNRTLYNEVRGPRCPPRRAGGASGCSVSAFGPEGAAAKRRAGASPTWQTLPVAPSLGTQRQPPCRAYP